MKAVPFLAAFFEQPLAVSSTGLGTRTATGMREDEDDDHWTRPQAATHTFTKAREDSDSDAAYSHHGTRTGTRARENEDSDVQALTGRGTTTFTETREDADINAHVEDSAGGWEPSIL